MNKILFFIIFINSAHFAGAQPQKDSIVCGYFEPMPEAPYNVQKYLMENLRYPKDAESEDIEGRVMMKFVVTETGGFDSIRVAKPLYPSLDAEALRVISTMPPWKPGKKGGKPVRVPFTMPVVFRIE
ncbi:energy transducer TonB [Polluticoccus soli]|uniref:energy transducer TonB n=1 Tax=Polluticoccus soli TaxID=3034150 RepID=UPI0023E1D688|nr:energy transducer TonB [Flavipsychrobacter sp. JY13-12]